MKIMTARGRLAALLTLVPLLPIVVAPPAHAGASQCPSGSFCVWTKANFGGELQKFSATNSYRTITLDTTESYYNHRTKRTWLSSGPAGSGERLCIDPGRTNANTSGWQDSAQSVYLATVTSC